MLRKVSHAVFYTQIKPLKEKGKNKDIYRYLQNKELKHLQNLAKRPTKGYTSANEILKPEERR